MAIFVPLTKLSLSSRTSHANVQKMLLKVGNPFTEVFFHMFIVITEDNCWKKFQGNIRGFSFRNLYFTMYESFPFQSLKDTLGDKKTNNQPNLVRYLLQAPLMYDHLSCTTTSVALMTTLLHKFPSLVTPFIFL
jgi:hypothetical protein